MHQCTACFFHGTLLLLHVHSVHCLHQGGSLVKADSWSLYSWLLQTALKWYKRLEDGEKNCQTKARCKFFFSAATQNTAAISAEPFSRGDVEMVTGLEWDLIQNRQSESAGGKVLLHWSDTGRVPKNTPCNNMVSALHGILHRVLIKITWNLKSTIERAVQTIHFIIHRFCSGSSFLQKLKLTPWDIYKCHVLSSRLITFIFIKN